MSVLKDTYHECIEELSRLGSVENSVDVWAENQQARLQLWAATLGVVAKEHLSLAHRLRFNEEVDDILTQLLKGLHAGLELLRTKFISLEATSATSRPIGGLDTRPSLSFDIENDHPMHEDGQSDPGSPRDSSISSESEPDASKHTLQQEVEDSISRLLDLSALLRNHGAQQHEDRAIRFVPVDENGASMINDFVDWSKWSCQKSTENQNGFLPGEWMVERFERTMLRRWLLMCYCAHHGDRIANSSIQLPVVGSQRDIRQATVRKATSDKALPPDTSDDDNSVVTVKTKQSSAATQLPANYRLPSPTKRPRSSIASSKTHFMPGHHDFPGPPKVEESSKEFLCPYCRLPQQVKELKRSRWQIHVLRDLCPYICVFENCKSADAMYRTSELWMKHIQTEHIHETWHCDMCNKSLEFESPQAFASHLQSQHATTLSAEEVRVVSQFAASRVPATVDCCVVCGWSPPIGEFQALADLQPDIFKHMAVDHMQNLALLSLPWTGNPDGSLTVTSIPGFSRTSEDDYRNQLLQDPGLDPRCETEVDLSEIDPAGLSNIAQAFGQPEHDSNYTRSWLEAHYGLRIEQENTEDVMEPAIDELGQASLGRHSIVRTSPSITDSDEFPSRKKRTRALTATRFPWGPDVETWLNTKDPNPLHVADAIIPYLMTLKSWHLLYGGALTSLQGLQEGHKSPLLWLHGPPGCGKTTFAWAAREIRGNSLHRVTTILFYCFHPNRSMDEALRSLIYQVKQQIDPFPSLMNLYSSCASTRGNQKTAPNPRQPTTRELARCFEDMVAYSQHYFDIYLDSVDTCSSTRDVNFAEWLQDMADNNRQKVRIIATSRHAPVINAQGHSKTGGKTVLPIHLPKRGKDTSPYIHKVLRKDKFLRQWLERPGLGDDLEHRIASAVDRNFFMTQGLLHVLRRCSTVSEAEKRLKDVLEYGIVSPAEISPGHVPGPRGPVTGGGPQPRD